MKKIVFILLILSSLLRAEQFPGVPRDSNFNLTDGYDATRVEAKLVLNIKDTTKVVHFIRDNNDPRVVSKAYLIKNVDAYLFRDYLRQFVQAKRVGNTMPLQVFPGNTRNPNVAATSSVGTNPLSVNQTYSPSLQLGSNTAVECLKYADGTGLLIVSAEEYRFKDHDGGMGIDSLVKFLDQPQMGASFGTQTFLYIPKYVPARNLMPLIQNVGMNVNDVTELWQGADVVAYDPDLNWLVFDTTNYSMENIGRMLKLYDVPIPQVRLKITVYELYDENDDRMGLDFQAWKNNEGVDFFSAGGRYRDNWSVIYSRHLADTGSERTRFFNFNPKWNTRYLDFLASSGKAKIVHTGELCIRNNSSAVLERKTQIFRIDSTAQAKDSQTDPDCGVNAYRLLSVIIDEVLSTDYPVAKANQQKVVSSEGFGFSLNVTNASVNLKETSFSVTLTNSSLIGFESTGAPRIADGNEVNLTVSLPHGTGSFIIGGLEKQETVVSRTGIPWLMEIPYLGYLFSSVSNSVKHSRLLVAGECISDFPPELTAAK